MKTSLYSFMVLLLWSASLTWAQTISLQATPWPEADALFRRDPRWLGADDAYSVDLGKGRVLWLFADTFIATSAAFNRRESVMIHNTVAVQRGYDPASASIKFYWPTRKGRPSSFFPETKNVWYWPGHGLRVGDRLFIFLMNIRAVKTGLGFEAFGWTVIAIDNPDIEPSQWKLRQLPVPVNSLQIIVGSATVMRMGDFIYAFSVQEPTGRHDVFLVRWPVAGFSEGNLNEIQWWSGEERGWLTQSEKAQPIFTGAQTEFTVHWESRLNRFLQIQTEGFGPADLSFRVAENLTGPWPNPQRFYRPAEFDRSGIMIYAGKSHPALTGADAVLTYVVNRTDFGDLVSDSSVYYPRFLKCSIQK